MKYANVHFWTNSINITEIWNDRHFGKCHNTKQKIVPVKIFVKIYHSVELSTANKHSSAGHHEQKNKKSPIS